MFWKKKKKKKEKKKSIIGGCWCSDVVEKLEKGRSRQQAVLLADSRSLYLNAIRPLA